MRPVFSVRYSGTGSRRSICRCFSGQLRALVTLMFFLTCAVGAMADSAHSLVKQGNAAYSQGKYEEAISAYEDAGVDVPESPHLYFNKGAVYYQQQDYEKAKEAFADAASKSKDLKLEARSRFNLGNCAFRESERQRDSDLDKSLGACEESIRHYQDALRLDPEFKEAAQNIEIVRLLMKTILDEINKKKEELQKQQEAQQQAAEKLKELIEKQEELTRNNQSVTKERTQKGDSQEVRDKISRLADDQEQLQQGTDALAQSLPPSQPQQPTPADQVRERVDKAMAEQGSASDKLDKQNMAGALPNQREAEKELKNALAALTEPPQEQQGEQQNEQENNGGEEQQQSAQEQESTDEEQQQDEQPAAQLSEEAQNILDEEKENQERRKLPVNGNYREVDRDW